MGTFYEIRLGGSAIEGDLNAIIFNPLTSTLSTSKMHAKLAPVSDQP
jgi:hypothetical protein